MREILFKGKRKLDGMWVIGDLSQHKNGKKFIKTGSATQSYEVYENTICQYTGLTDKNGNRIWENDVLSISKKMDSLGTYYFPAVKYPVNVSVKWDLCAWMWETIAENKHYISFPDAWCHYEAEVIGNAFDNTELLKGE